MKDYATFMSEKVASSKQQVYPHTEDNAAYRSPPCRLVVWLPVQLADRCFVAVAEQCHPEQALTTIPVVVVAGYQRVGVAAVEGAYLRWV
jgi:hypothetical protein